MSLPERTTRLSSIIFPVKKEKKDPDPDHHFIGYRITAIPDFLSDHTQLGDSQEARLKDHCRRWANFVGSLWLDSMNETNETIVYNLRFCYQPKVKSIQAYLFISSSHHDIEQRYQELKGIASHIESGLSAQGFVKGIHFKSLTESQDFLKEQLRFRVANSQNTSKPQFVYQVTQSVDRSNLTFGKQAHRLMGAILENEGQTSDARDLSCKQLVIEPWWGPGGSFTLPFSLISHQAEEVTLSIIIQPTKLSKDEVNYFKEKIAFLTSGANFNFSEDANGKNAHQMIDPYVSWLSKLFAANLQRMKHPFLGLVHVISSDKFTAKTVANSLASQICQEAPFDPPENDYQFRNVAQALGLNAQQSHVVMQFYDGNMSTTALASILQVEEQNMCGSSVSPEDYTQQHRLPFMFDAKGISTVFRMPVSVRGGIQGLAVKQTPPHFEPGPQREYNSYGQLVQSSKMVNLGWFPSGEMAVIPLAELKKHVLITGFTGSGKTKTVLHLLDQLREHNVPWLVLESAKAEYRGLLKMEEYQGLANKGNKDKTPKLSIFTLGNEAVSPLRLNPFEIMPGITVEQHISRLVICFEAAFPPLAPLQSMLSEALPAVYRDLGWGLSETLGETSGPFAKKFPTMSLFNLKLQSVLNNRGYRGEIQQNLNAAIAGRVKPFTLDIPGSRSLMLDCERCTPSLDTLFSNNTILELNDLNSEDKSLVVMFLLVFLREFREVSHQEFVGSLEDDNEQDVALLHMTVIEEAHNILSNVADNSASESSGNAQFKAVEAFSSMLTEVRAYGEGIVIADQSPKKLHPDAMRNTNLQIAHVIRDRNDRDAVAAAMLMSEIQQDYIGKLKQGHAALFYTGLENASFVKIPHYQALDTDWDPEGQYSGKGKAYVSNLSNEYLVKHMWEVIKDIRAPEGPFQKGCEGCKHFCQLRAGVAERFDSDSRLKSEVDCIIDEYDIFLYNDELKYDGSRGNEQYRRSNNRRLGEIYGAIYRVCGLNIELKALSYRIDQKRCEFLHSWVYVSSLGAIDELERIADPREYIQRALNRDFEESK